MKNDELRRVAPLGTSQNLAVLEVKNEELRVKSLEEADKPKLGSFAVKNEGETCFALRKELNPKGLKIMIKKRTSKYLGFFFVFF